MCATSDRAPAERGSRRAPATGQGWTLGGLSLKWILLVVWVLLFLIAHLTGCGYTILEHPASAPGAGAPDKGAAEPQLPPGHPPIDDLVQLAEPESWEGLSFLDAIVGEDDPLRFENVRNDRSMRLPSQHSQITLRLTQGGPAVSRIWQLRVDEHGWVVVSHWTQPSSGFELNEDQAAERAEFRLSRESEAALRAMLLAMMPIADGRTHRVSRPDPSHVPIDQWTFDETGLLELDYRIETLDRVDSAGWPGGAVAAPLDLVQLLLSTWDAPPPAELRDLVNAAVAPSQLLLDLAMLVEGLVLAWEVEGPADPTLTLPLRVGR